MISEKPYIFKRTLQKGDFSDQVLVVMDKISSPIDVSGIFEDGTMLQDYYSGAKAKVENGQINFDTSYELILIAE